MNNLVLHAGGVVVGEEEVRSVPVPEATSSYIPVPYGDFLDELQGSVEELGLDWGERQLALSRNGNRLFGVVNAFLPVTENLMDLMRGDEHGFAVGFRSSYDKSMLNEVVAGFRVFVCDNLAFYGEAHTIYRRRHTLNVLRDLPRGIREMLARAQQEYYDFGKVVARMREVELTDSERNDLLVRCIVARALAPQHLLEVLREDSEPETAQFVKMDKTVWRLFNAVTQVSKRLSLQGQLAKTTTVSGIFANFVSRN